MRNVQFNFLSCDVKWRQGDGANRSVPLTAALAQGANTFTLVATHNQNRTAQASTTVYLDSIAPVISITAPANNSSFNTARINVSGNFTETSLKQITVNGVLATITGTSYTALNVPIAVGANTIVATAQDLAGNQGTASIAVTGVDGGGGIGVDPVQLAATPIGGFAPLLVSFTPTANVPGTLQSVFYDFDGDGTNDQTVANLNPITHTYSSPGQFFPVVTIQTSAGKFSSPGGWTSVDPSRLRINVQSPPIVLQTISVTDPIDLKWMPGGYLYVLSRSTAKITEYDSAGTIIRSLAAIGTTPTGLDVDNDGRVYVAINGDNQVRRYVPTSTSFQLDTTFNGTGFIGKADKSTGSGNGEFNAPYDVAVSPDGEEIDISDSANHRIQRFTKDAVFLSTFGTQGSEIWQFNAPKGLAFDSIGYMYVADSGNNRISLLLPPGAIGASGSAGTALGSFQGLVNMGVNNRGIYSAETGNNRVQFFDPLRSGHGIERTPFSVRGSLSTVVSLNQPSSVAPVGDFLEEKLYIADTGNNRVMLVRLPLDNPEAVWAAMQQRLVAGDVDGAVLCFSALSGDSYREFYLSITRQELSAIIGQIPPIRPVTLTPDMSQYRFDQKIEGYLLTFPVNFTRENGQWKVLEY